MLIRSASFLDLGEDVAREQHRAPLRLHLVHHILEHHLHQRIQTGGRFVEQQQLRPGGKRRHDGDLLPVALRVGAALLRRIEVEPLDEFGTADLVETTPEPTQQIDGLAPGEVGPQLDITRDVCHPAMKRHGVEPRVAPEHLDPARVRPQQPEQHPNGGRLPGTVGAEEPVHLTDPHG